MVSSLETVTVGSWELDAHRHLEGEVGDISKSNLGSISSMPLMVAPPGTCRCGIGILCESTNDVLRQPPGDN
jgi:hypothetical protein